MCLSRNLSFFFRQEVESVGPAYDALNNTPHADNMNTSILPSSSSFSPTFTAAAANNTPSTSSGSSNNLEFTPGMREVNLHDEEHVVSLN